jgi:hypothetical protein
MPEILKQSVQSLLIQTFFEDEPLAKGTAFVCLSKKGPVLVTNWHNVTGMNIDTKQPICKHGGVPDSIRIHHNRANTLGQWVWKTEPLLTNNKPRWIEHPILGDKADVVALPLTDLQDVHLEYYDPVGGPDIAVKPADIVSVVGFPFGLQVGGSCAIWATGFVASEPEIDYDGLPIFLVDCRTRKGQSGSAVIAHRNGGPVTMHGGAINNYTGPVTKFLGIYSGRVNEESDLGKVWKASAVARVIGAVAPICAVRSEPPR